VAARVITVLAVIATLAVDATYISIVRSVDGPAQADVLTVPFVAGYMLLMAALLAASLFARPVARPALRAAASAGLFVLGVLAAFTIGAAILIAAALAIASTVLAMRAKPGARSQISGTIAAVLAVALLGGGFEFTWNHLVCPPTGESGGSTASFLGHGSSYDCNNGVLTVH
jgi:hypothetical protein